MGGKAKNIGKTLGFLRFLALLGCWEGWLKHLGGCLCGSWLDERILLQIVAHVGAKMANKRGKMVSRSAKMRQHKL